MSKRKRDTGPLLEYLHDKLTDEEWGEILEQIDYEEEYGLWKLTDTQYAIVPDDLRGISEEEFVYELVNFDILNPGQSLAAHPEEAYTQVVTAALRRKRNATE